MINYFPQNLSILSVLAYCCPMLGVTEEFDLRPELARVEMVAFYPGKK